MNPEKKAYFLEAFQRQAKPDEEACLCKTALRCVLDTNVLMDLWVFEDVGVAAIHEALSDNKLILLGHEETFCEFADVIGRTQFNRTDSQIASLMQKWLSVHRIYSGELHEERFCDDDDDNKFFVLARDAHAPILVSKDKKVLKARSRAKKAGVTVMSVQEFLNNLALKNEDS